MAVTRINNNQISDALTGNTIVGINANTKLQNYSITSTKIANNLTYGSDLTVTGNLTVQGQTTTVDTVNTLIQDPLITLADGQTSGTPTLDIGTIGLRGSENSAVMGWKESALEFVTALSTTTVSNTTFTISSYANLHTGNFIAQGTTSLVGNLIGVVNATDTITGGNLATAGTASATGNITGGNILTGGLISATSTITSGANITGANILTGGLVSATATITGGNLETGGTASVTGNITGGNVLTSGLISAGGNITSATNVNTPNVVGATGMTISTGSGDLNLSPAGNVVLDNTYINGVAEPVQPQDAATKYYVDTVATTGLTFHEAVVAATNTTLATATGGTITYTQPNGVSNGVGAYIQTSGSFNTIDTANIQTIGTRILVKNEANAVLNGVYTWSNNAVIVRSTDTDQYGADSAESFSINDYFFTTSGNVNAGAAFVVDAPSGVITFGTSNISFAQFSSSQTYTANTAAGLLLINQQFNAKVDNNTTAFSGGGNIEVKAGANLTTPNIGAATGTSLNVTGNIDAGTTIIATGNITGGNVDTAGLITATGNVTGGNVNTAGLVTATGNITGGNVDTAGLITATGNIYGGNLILAGAALDTTAGRLTVNSTNSDADFAVNGDTVANVFYVDAGTGTASFGNSTQTVNAIVAFNSSTSILTPVGNTGQRPATGVTGMLRFNSTNNNLEIYDNSQWTAVGVPVFTVIDDEQFSGDGSTVAFTLATAQTTNSCIVSINGVVQIPVSAYSVSTTTLTFTEAPAPGDLIDVREITTTTTVTSIANSSGNAVISVSDTSATVNIVGDLSITGNATVLGNIATDSIQNGSSAVQIPDADGDIHFDINGQDQVLTVGQYNLTMTGNINPTANITYNLGNTTNRWNDLWLANSTIYMGNAQISANATSLIFTNPSGGQTVLAGSTGGNLTVGGLINSNANGVGNIGSSTGYFNTVFAKATSAQYADLAEKYTSDAEYAPGTVVVFGGTAEVTVNAVDSDRKVAGVISTNPSYIMNGGLEADHVATVALTGRVPTFVVGPVKKGDLMVAAGLGRARAEADPRVGTVIGKALEDFDGVEGTIEVVVGRF